MSGQLRDGEGMKELRVMMVKAHEMEAAEEGSEGMGK